MTAPEAIPIVDTHQHLWDLSRFSLPWTKGNERLGRDFLMSDYLQATAGLAIEQTVYMEVDVEPPQQEAEARYVIELCQRDDNPMTAAVISGRPASDDFGGYVQRLKSSPYIKGVRQVLHSGATTPSYFLDARFVRGVQLLGEVGWSFDLCLQPQDLLDADKLVAQCPHTRFIVDHCGNLSVQEPDTPRRLRWMEGMRHLADHDHVVCKISGIVATAKEAWTAADLAPNINFALDTFGADRVMFGGDWPVCTQRATFRQWVEALQEITQARPAADKQKLFHDNAVKFYGLPTSGKKPA